MTAQGANTGPHHPHSNPRVPPSEITLRVARLSDRHGRQRFAVVAEFGPRHCDITAQVAWANPFFAESTLTNPAALRGRIALINRGGGVSFFEKARRAQEAGAVAVVVINQDDRPFIAHHEPTDRIDGVMLPVVCMPKGAGEELLTQATCEDGVRLWYDPNETLTVCKCANARWPHLPFDNPPRYCRAGPTIYECPGGRERVSAL